MKLARSAILFFASLLLFPFGVPRAVATERDASRSAQTTASTSLPLRFEQNVGQVDSRVDYLVRTGGRVLFLGPDEAVYARDGNSVRMQLVGADPDAHSQALDQLPGVSNYLVGNDPSRWRTNVPSFGEVRFTGVYPGVDVRYYESDRALEYDVVVAPGGDPSTVAWKIEGADSIAIDPAGDLVITSKAGMIRQHAPIMYQELGMSCTRVTGGFQLIDRDTVAFDVGDYDRGRPLVIDPTIAYSTYLGGDNGFDQMPSIAVGPDGSAYLGGWTESAEYPLVNPMQTFAGSYDIVVTHLSPSGSELMCSTYLGGTSFDVLTGIAIDGDGNILIAGLTQGDDFPVVNAFQPAFGGDRDGVLVKLNPSGTAIVFSTYIGGTYNDGTKCIAIGSHGEIYVAGFTSSPDFPFLGGFDPTLSGYQDGIVSEFDAAGTLVASTFLGGSISDGLSGIAVGPDGGVYVAGNSNSADYPTSGPAQAAFAGDYDLVVTKLSADLSANLYGTYLGGTGRESNPEIAVDSTGGAYVIGVTDSTDYPVRSPIVGAFGGNYDGTLTRISPSGSVFEFSTYLGATDSDGFTCVAVGTPGVVYAGGFVNSTPFPVIDPLPGSHATPVSYDGFVMKIDTTAPAILFSTLLGGSDSEEVSALALDGHGNIFVSGDTHSADFPVVDPFQPTIQPVGYDGFVTKITDIVPPDITGAQSLVVTGKPFRIKVTGTNFQQGLFVTLGTDSTPWPTVKYKNETAIVVKGAQLKQHFPKGVPTQIRVANPDGGSDVYMFTR